MRRVSAAIFAALLTIALIAPAAFAAPAGQGATVPHVVIIVGPAGAATDGYRAQARAAAAVARRYTPDVVELYSPNATWPAVRQALAGASLVVYMGHGNGWPSPYRDSPYPVTQNGFGLNPTAGSGDDRHQYFGEAAIAAQVRLARNAVVLLNHLCYASGNSEPGRSEGTLDQARQRVDNYAAGFIKAGAAAVIAEAWSSPSYFVKAVLGGGATIQAAWQNAPSANGHRFAFESVRSPGYVAQMDPETASGGYTRSVVMQAGLAPRDVLAGASGSANAPGSRPVPPPEPTLIGTGLALGRTAVAALPAAGTPSSVDVAFTIPSRRSLPKGIQASVRWDVIDLVVAPVDPAGEVAPAGPSTAPSGSPPPADIQAESAGGSGIPTEAPSNESPTEPAVSPPGDPKTEPTPDEPIAVTPESSRIQSREAEVRIQIPDEAFDLVIPERALDVVAPTTVAIRKGELSIPVTMPAAAGRYRLTIVLHDPSGVAYDAATQALVPSVIVRVTGEFDGAIQAAASAETSVGSHLTLGARVINLGSGPWGSQTIAAGLDRIAGATPESIEQSITRRNRQRIEHPAYLVGSWVPLEAGASLVDDPAGDTVETTLPIGLAPGASFDAALRLIAPATPGTYLLVLDVVTPEHGSLVASGADPTVVRVTVRPEAPAIL